MCVLFCFWVDETEQEQKNSFQKRLRAASLDIVVGISGCGEHRSLPEIKKET